MRDIAHNIAVVQAVAPAVLTATANSGALDLIGFGSAAFVINTGAIAGDGLFTAKVQESDLTTAGSFTDVDPNHLHGAFLPPSQPIAQPRSVIVASSAMCASFSPRPAARLLLPVLC